VSLKVRSEQTRY